MESIIKSIYNSFSGTITVDEIIDLGYFKDYCKLLGIEKYTENDLLFEKILFRYDPVPLTFLKDFIEKHNLSEPFLVRLIQYQGEYNYSLWSSIVHSQSISSEFIELHWKEIIESGTTWLELITCNNISEEFIKLHRKEIIESGTTWLELIVCTNISENFIEKYWDEINKEEPIFQQISNLRKRK